MTDRIQELAAQAKAAVPNGLVVDKWIEAYNQIFAKLIVEECAAQCWTVSELESKGSVVNECAKRIRNHFGVE
jgi:hypothetical protein